MHILTSIVAASLLSGQIRTVGGSGATPSSPDGTATTINVGGPFGVSLGPDGRLFVCETQGHIIRRIDLKSGEAQTVAGDGKRGYSGDGGPATSASLNEPYEVRFDADGNMYFVEMQNHVVRRVDSKTGVITTVAGTGKRGYSGDDGPATRATLNRPHSITLDRNGSVYICDIGNHRIRRVDLKTGRITTFGGTGKRGKTPDGSRLQGTPLDGPRALDYFGGDLFLALREGNAVFRIDMQSQTLHHIAGTGRKGYSGDGGPATKARLSGPKGIAVGPNGDIYLADTESHTVRVIRKSAGTIETIIGNGNRGDGPDGNPKKCLLNRPHGIFVDQSGRVFVGDSSNNRVRMYVEASK